MIRRSSVDTSLPQKISDVGKFFLVKLNLLDKKLSQYNFNDHVWWYGQKIKELNLEPNVSYEEKKKNSNKKAKLMTKLNKINQITNTYQKDVALFNK